MVRDVNEDTNVFNGDYGYNINNNESSNNTNYDKINNNHENNTNRYAYTDQNNVNNKYNKNVSDTDNNNNEIRILTTQDS